MDEATLQEAVQTYKSQLAQIDSLIHATDESSRGEFLQLKKDVEDLIQTTEDTLLSLKKGKLMQLLCQDDSEDVQDSESEDPMVAFQREIAELEGNSGKKDNNKMEQADEEEEEDPCGQKCRVKYTHEWGVTEMHNAMILGKEDDCNVRVLFLHPTHSNMLPCPYFLEAKCRFTEEDCRYSHGFIVSIDNLEEYWEPDKKLLQVGQKCLAKYDDGVWYRATICGVQDDHIEVHFDTYDTTVVLDMESVLPVGCQDSSSSDSDDDDESEDELKGAEEDDIVACLSFKTTQLVGQLGDWEEHTKGIGSRLLAKMGYKPGKGLGKSDQGRVDPVEIVILPAGKSLDKVAEMREQGKLKKSGKRKKSRKSKNILSSGRGIPDNNQRSDVFDFINNKIGPLGHNSNTASSSSSDSKRHIEDSYKWLKKDRLLKRRGKTTKATGDSSLNLQLAKIHEKVLTVEKQLSKQREAQKRNVGRDANMVAALQRNIEMSENQLMELKRQERTVEQQISSKSEHKKLTIF